MKEKGRTGKLNVVKDYLISYTCDENQTMNNDEHVLKLAKTYLQREDCIRIIIEKGEI